jgi:hypothetical protein
LTDYADLALRCVAVFTVVAFIYLIGQALYDAVAHFDDVEEDEYDDDLVDASECEFNEFDETQEPR